MIEKNMYEKYNNSSEDIVKAQNGDSEALEKLVKDNQGLMWSIVKRFGGRGYELEELYQVANLGFIKCIKKFDTTFEVRLSTYAVPYILGEIKRYLRDNSSIRISRSIKDLAFKAVKIKEELTNANGKEPTISELAKALDRDEFEVAHALNSLKDTISMFEPIYNDGGDIIYLSDQLCNQEDAYSLDEKISLKNALNKLKPKEKYILVERYLVGKTQMELAEEIGISQAQISRLEKNGLLNIKKLID